VWRRSLECICWPSSTTRTRTATQQKKGNPKKVLNEALVKRIIPFIYRNRVWTLDESLWPITLENFKELDHHLSANLPQTHASRQWQTIRYFYGEIEREREEWRRLERLEREAMEAYEHCMAT